MVKEQGNHCQRVQAEVVKRFSYFKRWCSHRAFSNIPNDRNVYAISASYFFIFPLFLLPFPSNSPPQNSAVSGYIRIPSLRFPLKSFFSLFLAFPFPVRKRPHSTRFPGFWKKRRKTAVQKMRLFQVESKKYRVFFLGRHILDSRTKKTEIVMQDIFIFRGKWFFLPSSPPLLPSRAAIWRWW